MYNPMKSDMKVRRQEFYRRAPSKIVWIPGKENLYDPGTMSYAPFISAMWLGLLDGVLFFSFHTHSIAHRFAGLGILHPKLDLQTGINMKLSDRSVSQLSLQSFFFESSAPSVSLLKHSESLGSAVVRDDICSVCAC